MSFNKNNEKGACKCILKTCINQNATHLQRTCLWLCEKSHQDRRMEFQHILLYFIVISLFNSVHWSNWQTAIILLTIDKRYNRIPRLSNQYMEGFSTVTIRPSAFPLWDRGLKCHYRHMIFMWKDLVNAPPKFVGFLRVIWVPPTKNVTWLGGLGLASNRH
jgi:hypothetical protein